MPVLVLTRAAPGAVWVHPGRQLLSVGLDRLGPSSDSVRLAGSSHGIGDAVRLATREPDSTDTVDTGPITSCGEEPNSAYASIAGGIA
jgi:hypothetical protein